jgi:hypothetical protein
VLAVVILRVLCYDELLYIFYCFAFCYLYKRECINLLLMQINHSIIECDLVILAFEINCLNCS